MNTDFLKNSIVRASLSMLVGIALLIWPTFVANSLVRIIGIIALAIGVISIIRFFREKSNAILVAGIVEALAGLFLLFWPGVVMKIVFIVLAAILVIFAVEEIVRLVRANAAWSAYILPVALVALGVVIFFQPATSIRLVVILFGAALVIYGVSELITACRAGKKQQETAA